MITWSLKMEVVNLETDLRKVWATRTDDTGKSQTFFVKGLMKTDEEQKIIWDNIYAQHQAKEVALNKVDTVAVAGKANLEAREVK